MYKRTKNDSKFLVGYNTNQKMVDQCVVVLKEKNDHPRALYPAISFIHKGEIKAFSDTQRQRGFVTNRGTLQGLLRKSVSSRQMEQMRTRANEGDRDADTCW